MAPTSENAETLRGYDIVLSLSEEAINAQFRELYHKPLPGGRVPPPPGLKKFQPAPIPQYYINRILFILPPPDLTPPKIEQDEEIIGGQKPSTASIPPLGLRAHIECPHFQFHPTNPNTLIMSITFKAVPWTPEVAKLIGDDPEKPPAEEEVQEKTTSDKGGTEIKKTKKKMSHSKMSYMRSNGTAVAVKVDGWTVSWEVSVQVNDIEKIMDVVNASRNPTDQTLVTPEVEKQLESKFKSVDTTKFTASAVFCLFQTAQISSSFKLVGPNGEPPSGDEKAAMALRVSEYFGELHKKYNGNPTADTPYMLGYGIKATTTKLEQVNKDLKTPTATPDYFIPRRFDITTTPSKIDDDKKFTKGTLNFCMQTYRPSADQQVALQVTDEGKGRFEHPFFSTIKTPAFGLTGCDGILGFSQEIIRLWLTSFLDRFKADPNTLLKSAAEAPDHLGSLTVDINNFKKEKWQQGLGVTGSTTFHAGIGVDKSKYPGDTVETRRRFTGDVTTLIKYTSDLQLDPAKAVQAGSYRRVLLDFVFYFSLIGVGEIKLDEVWAESIAIKLKSQYKIGYTLYPGEGGTWAMTKDNDRSNVPAKGAEQVKTFNMPTKIKWDDGSDQDQWIIGEPGSEPTDYTQLTMGSANYGSVLWAGFIDDSAAIDKYKRDHNNEGVFVNNKPLAEIVQSVNASRDVHLDDIEKSMKGIFDSLRTTVILPAGNVFTFKTTDTDAGGHLYTSVMYRPATELTKT